LNTNPNSTPPVPVAATVKKERRSIFFTFFFFMTVLPYSLALPAPPPELAPGRALASCAALWMAWRILK
jgi:hypothetical protein